MSSVWIVVSKHLLVYITLLFCFIVMRYWGILACGNIIIIIQTLYSTACQQSEECNMQTPINVRQTTQVKLKQKDKTNNNNNNNNNKLRPSVLKEDSPDIYLHMVLPAVAQPDQCFSNCGLRATGGPRPSADGFERKRVAKIVSATERMKNTPTHVRDKNVLVG
jgi:hypothetical protein